MKAIVIGATGAVGKELVKVLLSRPDYETVITFTRRPLGIDSPKLESHVIDFDRPDTWEDLVRGDVLFSALGTSLKQAGSKEAQYKIDHDYQLSFARAARAKGVSHFVLVSSAGADPSSSFFYLKLKGIIEKDAEALAFPGLSILRPPSLIRPPCKAASGNHFCQSAGRAECFRPLPLHGPGAGAVGGPENGRPRQPAFYRRRNHHRPGRERIGVD